MNAESLNHGGELCEINPVNLDFAHLSELLVSGSCSVPKSSGLCDCNALESDHDFAVSAILLNTFSSRDLHFPCRIIFKTIRLFTCPQRVQASVDRIGARILPATDRM